MTVRHHVIKLSLRELKNKISEGKELSSSSRTINFFLLLVQRKKKLDKIIDILLNTCTSEHKMYKKMYIQ